MKKRIIVFICLLGFKLGLTEEEYDLLQIWRRRLGIYGSTRM